MWRRRLCLTTVVDASCLTTVVDASSPCFTTPSPLNAGATPVHAQASKFKKSSTQLSRKMWWKNMKLQVLCLSAYLCDNLCFWRETRVSLSRACACVSSVSLCLERVPVPLKTEPALSEPLETPKAHSVSLSRLITAAS